MKHNIFIILALFLLSPDLFSQTEEAEKAFLLKDFNTTIKLCNEILDTRPSNQEAIVLLGMCYQETQDYQKALSTYNKAENQENLSLLFLRAECMEVLGDINAAYSIYKSVYKKDSSQDHALRNLARIALKKKSYETAESYYTTLVEKYPDNYLFQKNLGTCKYSAKNEMGSLVHFRIAWDLNKKDLSLPISIANVHAIQQEPFTALRYLYEGLEYDSLNIPILKTTAIIHFKLEVYDTATYYLNRVIMAGDSSVFTNKYLGISLLNNFLFEASVPHLRVYYEDDTLNSEATYYLGLALTAMHNKEEGIALLNKTIDLMNPDSAMIGSVYASIARTWSDINDCPNSIKAFKNAIAYNPSVPIYIFELAKMYDQSGRVNSSAEDYKKAIATYNVYMEKQNALIEEAMKERGLDRDQLTAPGMGYSRERVKKIRDELFFLGEIEK